ncbi:MAG TPA: NUDIX hydrolase [Bacteroidia bacterium]|nr:NUDIX hydrolase [Bacteroidia bacterium]
MEHNPWITKKSEDVYESPWIKVVKHDVLNPAGKPATYSVVNFKNLAIGILPIDNEGFTWIVGQWRYPLEEYCWEIPEGGGPLGINPLDSAKRELKEETGIIAKDFQEIMRLHLSNSATNELAIVYLAKNLDFESAEPEESEVLQVKRIHLNEAYDWVMTGKITDAISVAAILKTKIMMEQGLI